MTQTMTAVEGEFLLRRLEAQEPLGASLCLPMGLRSGEHAKSLVVSTIQMGLDTYTRVLAYHDDGSVLQWHLVGDVDAELILRQYVADMALRPLVSERGRG